jgi:hypothetical protein
VRHLIDASQEGEGRVAGKRERLCGVGEIVRLNALRVDGRDVEIPLGEANVDIDVLIGAMRVDAVLAFLETDAEILEEREKRRFIGDRNQYGAVERCR